MIFFECIHKIIKENTFYCIFDRCDELSEIVCFTEKVFVCIHSFLCNSLCFLPFRIFFCIKCYVFIHCNKMLLSITHRNITIVVL